MSKITGLASSGTHGKHETASKEGYRSLYNFFIILERTTNVKCKLGEILSHHQSSQKDGGKKASRTGESVRLFGYLNA